MWGAILEAVHDMLVYTALSLEAAKETAAQLEPVGHSTEELEIAPEAAETTAQWEATAGAAAQWEAAETTAQLEAIAGAATQLEAAQLEAIAEELQEQQHNWGRQNSTIGGNNEQEQQHRRREHNWRH